MRIATIGLCDPEYAIALATSQYHAALAQLRQSVPELVDAGLQSDESCSGKAVASLGRQHAESPFDALVLVQAAWSRPDVLLQVLRAFPRLPMLLFAPGSPVVDGVIRSTAPAAGVGSTLPILRRHGIAHKLVWSAPGTVVDEADYLPFLRACRARRQLNGIKLGMVGFGDMRLQTTAFDVRELHESFGVEVESIDMLELQQGMDALEASEVDRQIAILTAGWQFAGAKPPTAAMRKVIAAYLVLDRIAAERGYAGMSIKCPTGVTAAMGFTSCLVGCLLARKYHYVCENDIPGLLGQVIAGLLSEQMSTYWELYEILHDGILFGCCGFCPAEFLAEPVTVRTYEGFLTGLSCCSRVKAGLYTTLRLGQDPDGRFLLHLAEGQATAPPPWYEDACGPIQHPSVLFTPDVPPAQFLQHLQAQHVAVVPGHWGEALREFAAMTGVRVVG